VDHVFKPVRFVLFSDDHFAALARAVAETK